MNFYPISEAELETFGTMNVLTNVLLAVGVGFVTAGIGIFVLPLL